MNARAAQRRLIVNADDFGRSASINAAVLRAHRDGILTSASLMVNEPACAEAVELARANPGLGVGLHLTLTHGHASLPAAQIPDLVTAQGEFISAPAATGVRYFFQSGLRSQLRAEIHAQFECFRATGLPLDHVNGHLHLHLHPVVFDILLKDAAALGIRSMRLTRDRFWLNARLASGRWPHRIVHALIFNWLSARARARLTRSGIRHTTAVFGLLQTGRMDEEFLLKLLATLPDGDSEIYSHPSTNDSAHELNALVSPPVRSAINAGRIELVRYQDL